MNYQINITDKTILITGVHFFSISFMQQIS